jgi:hypothetical protein
MRGDDGLRWSSAALQDEVRGHADKIRTSETPYQEAAMNAIKGIRMKNPAHPGGFVKSEIVEALELSVTDAAKALGVTLPLCRRCSMSGPRCRRKWRCASRRRLAFRWIR